MIGAENDLDRILRYRAGNNRWYPPSLTRIEAKRAEIDVVRSVVGESGHTGILISQGPVCEKSNASADVTLRSQCIRNQ